MFSTGMNTRFPEARGSNVTLPKTPATPIWRVASETGNHYWPVSLLDLLASQLDSKHVGSLVGAPDARSSEGKLACG